MMPMQWMLIFITSLSFLYILISLIYFFHLPSLMYKKPFNMKSLHKWNWVW